MRHLLIYRFIDEVAKAGSIRKAAETLAITPSALNRRILALEEELGVPLYHGAERKYGAVMDQGRADTGNMVVLQTSDSVDDVAAFYKKELGEGNMVSDMKMLGNRVVMFKEESGKEKVAITIQRADSDNTTNISIIKAIDK